MEKIILTAIPAIENGYPVTLHRVNFEHSNGPHMGWFQQDVDGYFYFIYAGGAGYWQSYTLRWIADKLDEINKPWDDHIKEYFEKEREREQDGNRQE